MSELGFLIFPLAWTALEEGFCATVEMEIASSAFLATPSSERTRQSVSHVVGMDMYDAAIPAIYPTLCWPCAQFAIAGVQGVFGRGLRWTDSFGFRSHSS